jgi:hypothetical protein
MHTLGGLPRFLFCPVEDPEPAPAIAEGLVIEDDFLFLLPLGRPRPRFCGEAAAGSLPAGPERGAVRAHIASGTIAFDASYRSMGTVEC